MPPGRASKAAATVHAAAALCALLVGACAPFRPAPDPNPPPEVETPAPAPTETPRAVIIIHGDADYLYHDARGNRLRADETALAEARAAAGEARHAEVFIFHQRTTGLARLAGASRGRFEHYRFGARVEHGSYVRRDASFSAEAELLKLRAKPSDAPLLLAYFGHEIPPRASPPRNGADDHDEKDARLTIDRFAQGLDAVAASVSSHRGPAATGSEDTIRPYAVVILSTCYGGTPEMMRRLAPRADFAVASPAALHLSHLNIGPLRGFGDFGSFGTVGAVHARVEDPAALRAMARRVADSVARASFERLRLQTFTEVTVAVYDLREAAPPALTALPDAIRAGASTWTECARDADQTVEEAARGVTLYFRPPRFGAGKNTTRRSAWQCPPGASLTARDPQSL